MLWTLFVVGVCTSTVLCQKDQPFSDYEADLPPDQLAKASGDENANADSALTDDGEKGESELEDEGAYGRTKFTDERFAKLFPSRVGRGGNRSLMPKAIAKPKPTLPSFIKNSPALIRVQVTTQSPRIANRQRAIASTTPRRTSTTSTTARPRNRSQLNSRQNNLSGRLSTTPPPSRSVTSTLSTTPIPARRRFNQNSGISRFQRNNSTIPALNPRRNWNKQVIDSKSLVRVECDAIRVIEHGLFPIKWLRLYCTLYINRFYFHHSLHSTSQHYNLNTLDNFYSNFFCSTLVFLYDWM